MRLVCTYSRRQVSQVSIRQYFVCSLLVVNVNTEHSCQLLLVL